MRVGRLLRREFAILSAEIYSEKVINAEELSGSYPKVSIASQINRRARGQHRANCGPGALNRGCTGIGYFISSGESEVETVGCSLDQRWVVDIASA